MSIQAWFWIGLSVVILVWGVRLLSSRQKLQSEKEHAARLQETFERYYRDAA